MVPPLLPSVPRSLCLLLLLSVCLIVPPVQATTLGSNFIAFNSTTAPQATLNQQWVNSFVTVPTGALPFTTIDWTVLVVFIPYLTHSYPPDLELQLCDPASWCTYPGLAGSANTCTTFYNGPQIFDNQTYQASVSSSIPCSPGSMTANGAYYASIKEIYDFENSAGQDITVLNPFGLRYAGDPAAGTWLLGVYDTSSSQHGTLTSSQILFYSGFFFRLFPSPLLTLSWVQTDA